ncbi:hypothetical protein SAY87_025222 [Trapa incisa]|uniref:tryptophan--tRNA ligase n=1 Tax=Trapa incisa TaxID=236973 RepID=A0AAN7GHC9_9MYRT|nr:hypothetical protein SAY87_025222 [Trapa incisa]
MEKDEINAEAVEAEVNPWEVSGKIDYDKLIDKFGCQRLDQSLIDRVHRFTSHFSDFSAVACSLRIVNHDEKCMWKNLSVEESQRLPRENAKDIIACGFDLTRTFIFSDFDYVGGAFYKNMVKVSKCVTYNKAVPSFPSSFPHLFSGKENLRCLIPCAIDQDPYFRMTRDVAPQIGYHKPALIELSFSPALQGDTGKMSVSDPNSAIYVTDTPKEIKDKINKYAFTGGQDTKEKQRLYGANLEEYGSGRMLTFDVKKRLIEVLTELVERHKRARAAVTEEMVDTFMAARPLPSMFS